MSDCQYWLGFSLVPEIGPKRLSHLLTAFGNLAAAWTATETQLHQSGLEKQPLTNLLQVRQQLDLDAEMAKVEKAGARLVTLVDDEYPAPLKTLPDAPAVLYVRGRLTPDDERALSVVGTRRATSYGRDAAYSFAKQLAAQDITIISGLAHGIDSAAHRGALDGGGRTLAVLGCGIDRIYPADNQKLATDILRHGAIISEFPIGTPPEAHNFPRRNRIISGLSLGVLVVEAPEKSGALITTTMAAEQGREVFAIPGNIFNPMSSGTNRLIQDGAKLVMTVEDILEELNIVHTAVQTSKVTERIIPANDIESRLLEHLGADPIHVDDLTRLSGLPVATVSSTLTILELKGLARTVGQMQYCLVRIH
ncbi:MAG TPA: DNA-processing protein DprA [Phototrophicaceae bacterium]|nr:DNA-processing protein DprA [Phototrophicaceae bacterium]